MIDPKEVCGVYMHALTNTCFTLCTIFQGEIYNEDWSLYVQSKTCVTQCMHINST